MKRRSCRDFAEARSAYVDGHLGEQERQQLLRHLSDCAACRHEVAEIQRLRSLLTDASRTTPAAMPADLSHRLAAIAAGTSGEPSLVDAGNGHRRALGVTVSAAGVALVLALLAGVGYVAAPTESAGSDPAADPAAAVRADFSAITAQLPLTGAGVAAAVLVDPAGLRAEDVTIPSEPTMAGGALEPAEITRLLHQAEQATGQVRYSGVQRVLAPRDDGSTAADVEVDALPRSGTEVVVRTVAGAQVTSGTIASSADSRIAGSDLLGALRSSYQLTGVDGGTLLGRPVTLIEAFTPGAGQDQPSARWWIDDATGLVLRQQTFDHAGRLVLMADFTEFRIGANTPNPASGRSLTEPVTTAAFTTASAARLSSEGWFCHSELAGMSLIRLRADAAQPGVLHMVYTDGLSTVSVFERRGPIATSGRGGWDPNLGAYRDDAILNTASWQSGDATFTVATNGSVALRNDVVAALPHDEPAERTTMESIRAGWSRILERVG